MKRILLIVAVICTATISFSQDTVKNRRKVLSVNFVLNDFSTPERIKATSLGSVLKSWSKFGDMSPGLALHFHQQLSNRLEFMSTFAGSFVDNSFINNGSNAAQWFLVELDANANYRLFGERTRFSPYLTAGTGVSKLAATWGAYIPVGAGLQIKLSEETSLLANLQYRIGVTGLLKDHFYYSIGFGAPIGR